MTKLSYYPLCLAIISNRDTMALKDDTGTENGLGNVS